jgi:hypothetical protein
VASPPPPPKQPPPSSVQQAAASLALSRVAEGRRTVWHLSVVGWREQQQVVRAEQQWKWQAAVLLYTTCTGLSHVHLFLC